MPVGKSVKTAEDIIKAVGIPPQPDVILKIKKEIESENPNLLRIADMVSQDVGLTASTLKLASSPFIGYGQITSVLQALNLLGSKNFYNLILTSALRDALTLKGLQTEVFEAFWRHSLQVAKSSVFVMKRINKKLIDDIYLAALFHDCAIAIMLKRFDNYTEAVDYALSPCLKSILIEERLFSTNHCVVGYVLAKSWHLPQEVYDSIMWHHSSELRYLKNDKVKLFVNCIRLAECILYEELENVIKTFKTQLVINPYKIVPSTIRHDSPVPEEFFSKMDIQRLMETLEVDEELVNDIREDIRDVVGM